MSVGPLGGIAAGAAGSPLAQSKGSEVERSQQEAGAQQRRVETSQKAETAAGIGETDGEDHQTGERDADGRRLWEAPARDEPKAEADEPSPPQSKDASGQSGSLLDLTG